MRIRHILLISLLIRLLAIPFFYHPDIKSQYFHFQYLSKGVANIYEFVAANKYRLPNRDTFNYLPLTYFSFGSYYSLIDKLPNFGISYWINDWGESKDQNPEIPFYLFLLKLPYLLCDYFIAWLIFKIYRRHFITYLWLLNPITIYLLYILGNFDVVTSALTVLAFYLLKVKRENLSFIVLGIAIALKLYPLIFVPFFIFYNPFKFKRAITNSILVILPLAITLLPFVNSNYFWTSFLGSGLTQKIIEIRLFSLPIFPLFYLFILFSYIWHQNNYKHLNFEYHLTILMLLFISLVNFHPQWLVWFFPFFLTVLYFKKINSFSACLLFALILFNIALINDEYLFWGHLIPIDPAYTSAISPYKIVSTINPFAPVVIQRLIHLIFFIYFIFYWLKDVRSGKN